MKTYDTDVAIIGAGPSGLFMVFEAGFLGYRSVIVDALPQVGGQLAALYPEKPIYDVPGHAGILAGELVEKIKVQADAYRPDYLLGQAVETVEAAGDGYRLTTPEASVTAKCVVIAGGGGMFAPRKPKLEGLDGYEAGKSVVYSIKNKHLLDGKDVVVAGGGDSALDWVLELSTLCNHVHLVHRRADFRAAEATVNQVKNAEREGKVTIHTPFEVSGLVGDGTILAALEIRDGDGTLRQLKADTLVCCFGLLPNAGPFGNWDLGAYGGLVPVDHASMMTRRKGIFCIGDMATYDGKLPLILTGFAEAAVAAKSIQAVIHPDKKFKVQYSTSKGMPGK